MAALSPYSTALELRRPAPDWVPTQEDKNRVQAYDTYEDIWFNVKEAFTSSLRVDDTAVSELGRRYIAGARMLVEATNRYLGLELAWSSSNPVGVTVPDATRIDVMARLDALFKREEFPAKFAALKRWLLIRGDALLHLTADPLKPEGSRLRITELSPRTYFPIHDPVDEERVTGCYIVTQIIEGVSALVVASQRLEYHKVVTPEDLAAAPPGAALGSIWYRVGYFEPDGWDDRLPLTADDLAPVDVPASIPNTPALAALMTGVVLPAAITAIPVYHFRYQRRGSAPFGVSELQGLETVLAGLTQTATDEDLAIALTGIGVYFTDSGAPVDAQGNEVDWIIAPASVIELEDGKTFGRVQGIDKVDPMQDHFSLLKQTAQEVSGIPDVAVGKVDVQVAQSGIALAIQMAPIVAKNAETEKELKGKLDQFMFDLLAGWMPSYEGVQAGGLVVESSFGSPIPVDRTAVLKEILDLTAAGLISTEFARQLLSEKLGYEFPADMLNQIVSEQAAMLDSVGSRLGAAANAAPPGATTPPGPSGP